MSSPIVPTVCPGIQPDRSARRHCQADLLTDGERFASRTTVTGTHAGDLMGMPATLTTLRNDPPAEVAHSLSWVR